MSTTALTPSEIAEAIATARKAHGLNQSELARAVGVTPQAVQKWELGTAVPRYSRLQRVASALNLNLIDMVAIVIKTSHGKDPAMPIQSFTCAERSVARDVSTNATDVANDNDLDAGSYLRPIANAVLRGDLSDKAMASLGRELLQVYQRDVIGLVISADTELDTMITELEGLIRQRRALLPNVLTFNGTARMV